MESTNLDSENTSKNDEKMIELTRYLEESAEKLKELDRQKDAFLDIAAHELKTPITSIQGFAQLMQDESILADIEKSKHYLELISHNSNRLYYLILNMIDAFKIINNDLKRNVECVDLYELFNSTKNNFEGQILSKGIIPGFYIEDNLPKMTTDSEKISRTLRNLLSNSINYTESGNITLRIYRDSNIDGNICFEVKDTGRGIPKEHHEFLFSTFYQIDASLNRKSGGIGLGLFISKGLVENIGGKIRFESAEGKGSEFRFSIPIICDVEMTKQDAGDARETDEYYSESKEMDYTYHANGGNEDGQ
jgi:two-component system, OmpR family, phosphate regulon sensor histidine kinase PhoR